MFFDVDVSHVLTLSTVGSTRALFFLGGWAGSPPELVPSPAPGAGWIHETGRPAQTR